MSGEARAGPQSAGLGSEVSKGRVCDIAVHDLPSSAGSTSKQRRRARFAFVTISEDQARNHKDHGPRNIALLRRLALNLAKLEGSKEPVKGKLCRAALGKAFLARLLAQFGKTQMR